MFLPLGSLYVMNQYVDAKDEEHIHYCRIFFGAAQAITALVLFLIYNKATSKPEDTDEGKMIKVTTKPAPPFGPGSDEPPVTEMMTERAHDVHILRARVTQMFMQTLIVSGIHWKWGMVQPLVISSVIGFYGLVKWEPVKVHLLGMPATGELKRPWSAEGKVRERRRGGRGEREGRGRGTDTGEEG